MLAIACWMSLFISASVCMMLLCCILFGGGEFVTDIDDCVSSRVDAQRKG